MINVALRGRPNAGSSHARIDEGEVASEKPRHRPLLYKQSMCVAAALLALGASAVTDYYWTGAAGDNNPITPLNWAGADGTAPADAEQGAGGMIAATVENGAGRMAFFTDALVFQPFRIEHDDNANLLINTFGWLTGRPVDSELRRKFRSGLFLAEADLVEVAKEEQ